MRRWESAVKDSAFDRIRNRLVVTTQADDFKAVLRAGTTSTNGYLRRLQNYSLDMGWLPGMILPRKRGSQSDIANLQAEDIDYKSRCFVYDRLKTGQMAGMRIGAKAWKVILRRPRSGPLFPYLVSVRASDRATEFKQRCDGLGIKGVTLHSYRYAWAERSADNGYPERYAQRVLGQNSKLVHRAYAKKAQGELPSLEDYEEAARKAKKKGKVVVLKHESEMPQVR